MAITEDRYSESRRKKETKKQENAKQEVERLEEEKRKEGNVEQEQSVETEKKRSRGDGWNYGMIIGNSDYSCKGLTNLPTVKADRKLIVNRLGNRETYNIDFTNSEHKTQIGDFTNVEDIIGQVEEFMEQVEAHVKEERGRG